MQQLSIIIVNYKSPQLVIDCLNSLQQFNSAYATQVVVVDNHSQDDSRSRILGAFPNVNWLEMNYNSGFARANNEAIRRFPAMAYLLLNSDTLINSTAIQECYEQFIRSPYAACGVQLLNADGSPQISGNYFMTGSLNNLLSLPYVGLLVKWVGTALKVKKPHVPETNSTVEVDWINGAFLMVKHETVQAAGLMDEDFFLYAEEAEWCSRIQKKAGPLCIFGQYTIIHLQGETSNKTFGTSSRGYANLADDKGYQIMLSNFVRIRKQNGSAWFWIQLLIFTVTIPVCFIAGVFDAALRGKSPVQALSNSAGFSRNVARVWKLAAKIHSGKPYFYKVL